ncbi:hypothetical protein [Roseicyclus mahoneyensis]|uniref:Uncharacterized protein n=1 Tax=Roseicyclus mahoneyensis TaxID=164332 RepID=A0A316GKW1_9RHOB|nr:hypothetical protein [Roseicyclus mahoneyensis]PWK61472.1 hypothetical protein C7455_102161 [Roseicyclus mahoneyensis]
MEWDQIAEKWSQMALRLRSDSPTGARLPGASRVDDAPARAMTQTPPTLAPRDGLSRTRSTGGTGNDRSLTPDR